MSRTFTQIRTFLTDGTLIHDFFKVPKGKSAIGDMIINVQYYGGSDKFYITIAAVLTKADGSSGSILIDTFNPASDGSLRVLRLERCALESEDMISVNVSTSAGVRFSTSVYLGGVLQ